jgi:hypothetical protein
MELAKEIQGQVAGALFYALVIMKSTYMGVKSTPPIIEWK